MTNIHVPPSAMRNGGLAEHSYSEWHVVLPPEYKVEWLFQPSAWAHVNTRINKFDVIRCTREDFDFDFEVVVTEKMHSGLEVLPYPRFDGETGTSALKEVAEIAREAKVKVIPLAVDKKPVVRVDFLRATGHRMIGLDGYEETGFESKAAAEKAMHAYVDKHKLAWPEENAEPEPEAEPAKAEDAAPKPTSKLGKSPLVKQPKKHQQAAI